MNSRQNKLLTVPLTIPAIAPSLVVRFQKRAHKYTGKNATAQIPKKILVPVATIFPGKIYASTTAIIMAINIPIRVILRLLQFLIAQYTS